MLPKQQYEQQFVEDIIRNAAKGISPDLFAAHKLMPPRIIDQWREDHIEFDDAYKISMLLYRSYWEDKLLAAASDDGGNRSMMATAKEMLNRLNTSDKGETIYTPQSSRKKKKIIYEDEMEKVFKTL